MHSSPHEPAVGVYDTDKTVLSEGRVASEPEQQQVGPVTGDEGE